MSHFGQTRQKRPPDCRVRDVLCTCRIGLHWEILGALSSKCQVVPVPVLELYKLVIFMVGELRSHEDDQRKPLLFSLCLFWQISDSVKKGGYLHRVWGVKVKRSGSSRGTFGAGTKLKDLSSSLESLPIPVHYTGSYIHYTLPHQGLKLSGVGSSSRSRNFSSFFLLKKCLHPWQGRRFTMYFIRACGYVLLHK